MRAAFLVVAFGLAFVTTAGLTGQEPKSKDGPKGKAETKEQPTEPPKVDLRFKGQLPQNWGRLGLTATQKEKVYAVQATYNQQIDKLESQIRDLKAKMSKERYEVLSPEQKKELEAILKKKAGGK